MVLHERCRLGNQNWTVCGWIGIPPCWGSLSRTLIQVNRAEDCPIALEQDGAEEAIARLIPLARDPGLLHGVGRNNERSPNAVTHGRAYSCNRRGAPNSSPVEGPALAVRSERVPFRGRYRSRKRGCVSFGIVALNSRGRTEPARFKPLASPFYGNGIGVSKTAGRQVALRSRITTNQEAIEHRTA
jgi:hypothetical protein